MRSHISSRRSLRSNRISAKRAAARRAMFESLEPRQLFTLVVGAEPAGVLAHPATATSDEVVLGNYFHDSAGTSVEIVTTQGTIDLHLTDAATPKTVANFVEYIQSGAYVNTFFHRSVVLAGGTVSATNPSDIIQGGGYSVSGSSINQVSAFRQIPDEYTSRATGDIPNTIAMAKTSQANSAGSEFFFNIHDNTSALDTPTADTNGVQTSYTVFGTVTAGVDVIDKISALGTTDLSSSTQISALTDIPVAGDTSNGVSPSNLVFVTSTKVTAGTITYTAVSGNPGLVRPTVSNGVLGFAYTSGKFGTAQIVVTATDSADGSTVTRSFPVTVPDTTNTTEGPTAADDTVIVPQGSSNFVIEPLNNDTDSLAALSLAGITVTSFPGHGSVDVDRNAGHLLYTPNAGYTGSDSFTYTVADADGTVSAPATVNVSVAASVTIGLGGEGRVLRYTQPNGAKGTFIIGNARATISFAGGNVTATQTGAIITVTGADATISDIAVTNLSAALPVIRLVSTGGALSVGAIHDTGPIGAVVAPTTTLNGNFDATAVSLLSLGSTNQSTITIGHALTFTSLVIPTAIDTSVASEAYIQVLSSKNWTDTDSVKDTITAPAIFTMLVTGTFSNSLTLSSTGLDIRVARIGAALANATWTLSGSAFSISAPSMASTLTFSVGGLLSSLRLTGDLATTVTAASVGTVFVGGAMSNAVIFSNGNPTVGTFGRIGQVVVGRAITGSTIFAYGSTGAIVAAALNSSRIYSGVNITVAQNGALAAASTDFITKPKGTLGVVRLTGAKIAAGTALFTDSLITANVIGVLVLGNIQTADVASDGTTHNTQGISASSISVVLGTLDNSKRLFLTRAQLATAAKLNAYLTKQGITFTAIDPTTQGAKITDFEIGII